jgi:hypothetical protein
MRSERPGLVEQHGGSCSPSHRIGVHVTPGATHKAGSNVAKEDVMTKNELKESTMMSGIDAGTASGTVGGQLGDIICPAD